VPGDEHVFLSHYGTAAKRALSESGSSVNGPMQSRPVTEIPEVSDESPRSDILHEKAFAKRLCLERQRTDRSGRRFILLLLNLGGLLKSKDNACEFQAFVDVLSGSTREIDVKGWYKDGSVFAVIFTEIGSGDAREITKVLLTKVTDGLWSTLRVDDLNDIHLSFHVYPEDGPKIGNDKAADLTLYPDHMPEQDPKRASRVVKRGIDVLGSLCALVMLSPLILTIALAIKLTSRGPVLFRQKRVGQYGATFTFLKFRSMYMSSDDTIHKDYTTRFISGNHDADAAEGQNRVFKLQNDPRVTRIGTLLRRASLDELPQLLNVLHGEMSLVGPRPPLPYEVACYQPWHKRRLLAVKPGITGLWQVGGRSRVKFDDMVRLDLKYAETWSVWLDLKILWMTPTAVISGDGAY
jgi:lipopolysaccharide/colanic/teichoic acid biosynthesis glycosyltransferase